MGCHQVELDMTVLDNHRHHSTFQVLVVELTHTYCQCILKLDMQKDFHPLEEDTPRTHLSGPLASDAETIVVDMV